MIQYFFRFTRFNSENLIFFINGEDINGDNLQEVQEITIFVQDPEREAVVLSMNTGSPQVGVLDENRVQVSFDNAQYDQLDPKLYAFDLVIKDSSGRDNNVSSGMIRILPGQKTPA